MSDNRVFISITMENTGTWMLVTSEEIAKDFVAEWTSVDGEQLISIAGVLDHRDANEIAYTFRKGNIELVQILEIKV